MTVISTVVSMVRIYSPFFCHVHEILYQTFGPYCWDEIHWIWEVAEGDHVASSLVEFGLDL